jgi:K+-transporting ATPase KdpF subunit
MSARVLACRKALECGPADEPGVPDRPLANGDSKDVRCVVRDADGGLWTDLDPVRFWMREALTAMLEYVMGGIVTLGLLVYLVYALLRPDRF